jgi:hypothetical protein
MHVSTCIAVLHMSFMCLPHTLHTGVTPMYHTIHHSLALSTSSPSLSTGYLADSQIELTFQTAFREGGTPDRPSVAMYLSKHPNSHWQPLPGAVELSVSVLTRGRGNLCQGGGDGPSSWDMGDRMCVWGGGGGT